jgi:hypothetical protein
VCQSEDLREQARQTRRDLRHAVQALVHERRRAQETLKEAREIRERAAALTLNSAGDLAGASIPA